MVGNLVDGNDFDQRMSAQFANQSVRASITERFQSSITRSSVVVAI